jgi:CheY-like chemotaxis protein
MTDPTGTKQKLMKENSALKRKIKELEHSETEHKRTEEALRPSKENFNRSLDDSPLGVRIVTMEGETILLVDDEKMVLEVSKELLESLGYRVYAAGSGEEAIAVYMEKQKEIDLVILDMVMPGISGGETFDRLREINSDIKVLLSSGYSVDGHAREILTRGCNGFIQKPFNLNKFAQIVREILDRDGDFIKKLDRTQ